MAYTSGRWLHRDATAAARSELFSFVGDLNHVCHPLGVVRKVKEEVLEDSCQRETILAQRMYYIAVLRLFLPLLGPCAPKPATGTGLEFRNMMPSAFLTRTLDADSIQQRMCPRIFLVFSQVWVQS